MRFLLFLRDTMGHVLQPLKPLYVGHLWTVINFYNNLFPPRFTLIRSRIVEARVVKFNNIVLVYMMVIWVYLNGSFTIYNVVKKD